MAFDRLIRAIDEKKNPTVAGLDPKLDYVPEFIKKDSREKYDDNNKGHKLFVPKLAYNIDAPVEGSINILMMHHPLSRIKKGAEIQEVLDRKFQIQIFGHLHKPASDDNNAVHILSGAFQPPADGDKSEYFSVYNILELEMGDSDTP